MSDQAKWEALRKAAERAVGALEDRTAEYDMGRAGPASHEERVSIVAAALEEPAPVEEGPRPTNEDRAICAIDAMDSATDPASLAAVYKVSIVTLERLRKNGLVEVYSAPLRYVLTDAGLSRLSKIHAGGPGDDYAPAQSKAPDQEAV